MTTDEAIQHLKDAHADDAESLAIGVIEAELARLREIVDRLEKTKDGVYMVPDDEVYVVAYDRYGDDHDELAVIKCRYKSPTDPEGYGTIWPYKSIDLDSNGRSFMLWTHTPLVKPPKRRRRVRK